MNSVLNFNFHKYLNKLYSVKTQRFLLCGKIGNLEVCRSFNIIF